VRNLWVLVDSLKVPTTLESIQEAAEANPVESGLQASPYRSALPSHKFDMKIVATIAKVRSELLKAGELLLKQYLDDNLQSTFFNLFKMCPVHARVVDFAVFLLKKQVVSRWPLLLDNLNKYAARKFEEVRSEKMKKLSRSSFASIPDAEPNERSESQLGTPSATLGVPSAPLDGAIIFSRSVRENASLYQLLFDDGPKSIANEVVHSEAQGNGDSVLREDAWNQLVELSANIAQYFGVNVGAVAIDWKSKALNFSVPSHSLLLMRSRELNIERNKFQISFDLVARAVRAWTVIVTIGVGSRCGLSSAEVHFLAVNLHGLIVCLLDAAAKFRDHLLSVGRDDVASRSCVDVASFFTASLPSLLYFDHIRKKAISADSGNVSNLADNVLIAMGHNLLSERSFASIIVSTCRDKTADYYCACYGFRGMKLVASWETLKLLGRFLVRTKGTFGDGSIEDVVDNSRLYELISLVRIHNDLSNAIRLLSSRFMIPM
jgi:hypothetical protein